MKVKKLLYIFIFVLSAFIFTQCRGKNNEEHLKGNSWYKSYYIYNDTLKYAPPMTIIRFRKDGIIEDCTFMKNLNFTCSTFKTIEDIYYKNSKWSIQNDTLLDLPFGKYTILSINNDSLILKNRQFNKSSIEVWKKIVL